MSMPRVAASEVKEIISTTIDDSVLQTNMIDTAHVFVDTNLLSVGHSEAILAKIELYLAAHFVALTDEAGALKSSKVGDASDSWDTSWIGSGLMSTRYGQAALTLDTSGTLVKVGSAKLRAEFRVV